MLFLERRLSARISPDDSAASYGQVFMNHKGVFEALIAFKAAWNGV